MIDSDALLSIPTPPNSDTPVKTDNIFQVTSVTKQFNAAAPDPRPETTRDMRALLSNLANLIDIYLSRER